MSKGAASPSSIREHPLSTFSLLDPSNCLGSPAAGNETRNSFSWAAQRKQIPQKGPATAEGASCAAVCHCLIGNRRQTATEMGFKITMEKMTECNELFLLVVGGLHSLLESATLIGDEICLDQELVQLVLLLADVFLDLQENFIRKCVKRWLLGFLTQCVGYLPQQFEGHFGDLIGALILKFARNEILVALQGCREIRDRQHQMALT